MDDFQAQAVTTMQSWSAQALGGGLAGNGNSVRFIAEINQHKDRFMPAANPNDQRTPVQKMNEFAKFRPFVEEMAKQWNKDNGFVDRLAADVSKNPATEAKFKAAVASGQFDAADLRAYAANKDLAGQLNAATAPKVQPAPAKPAPKAEPKAEKATPRETPRAEPKSTTPHHVEPVVAAGAAISAPAAADTLVSADSARMIAERAADKIGEIYKAADGNSEFDSEVKTLKERLANPVTGPQLSQQIADAINKDPVLSKQLNSEGSSNVDGLFKKYDELADKPEVQGAIRTALKPFAQAFFTDPTKIADQSFRDNMASSAQSAGQKAGMNSILGGLGDMFGGLMDKLQSVNWGGMMQGLGGMLQPLIEMVGKLFGQLTGGHFMTSGNTNGAMANNFFGHVALTTNELSNIGLTPKDTNNDRQLSDGMLWQDADKSIPVMVDKKPNAKGEYEMVNKIGPDGKPIVKSESVVGGKKVVEYEKVRAQEQAYDEKLDDRITIIDAKGDKHRVFGNDGSVIKADKNGMVRIAYVTRINEKTGVPQEGEYIQMAQDKSIHAVAESKVANANLPPVEPQAPKGPNVKAPEPSGVSGMGAPSSAIIGG